MKKQDKGFTLVELLIVIVILGILATVTVFAVRGITDTGQQNACSIEARTLDSAVEAYYAQTGSEPTAVNDLVPDYLRDAPDTNNWSFSAGVAAQPGPDGVLGTGDDIPATSAGFTVVVDGACDNS